MICMDVNLKFYFDNLPNSKEIGDKAECEMAFA